MARGDPVYGRVEVTWPNDPRSQALGPAQNWLYMVCYLAAVEARSNVLPGYMTLTTLGKRAGMKRSTVESTIAKCCAVPGNSPILFVNDQGLVCVPGAGAKNEKLDWKGDRMGPIWGKSGADTPPVEAPRPSVLPTPRPNNGAKPDKPAVARRVKAKKLRPKKGPTGPHAEIIDHFCTLWEKRYGSKYAFSGGKEGTIFSRLLKSYSLEQLRGLVTAYLELDEEFVNKAGHTVGVFQVKLPALIAQGHDRDVLFKSFTEPGEDEKGG